MVGLIKLKVPLRADELTFDNIAKYLPVILPAFNSNARKTRVDYEYYKGQQDILNKTRRFSDDKDVNNKIVEPHLFSMVNFKTGYIFGSPIELAKKVEEKDAEINYLKNYLNSVDFKSLITNISDWVFASGVGYSFTLPKASKNAEYYAPFSSVQLDSDRCGKVYSSYLEEEPLFDIIKTNITVPVPNSIDGYIDDCIYSVYTKNEYYEFKSSNKGNSFELVRSGDKGYKELPLTEFYAYKDKIGIVGSSKTLNDALNNISSMSLDNVQELANEMIVLLNAILGKTPEEKAENLRLAKKNGLLELFDNNKDFRADVKTITTKLEQQDINVRYQTLLQTLYGCWGVPLSNNKISSGNVTKGGVSSSSGWDFAYSVALRELSNLMKGVKELIDHYISISKQMPNAKITTLDIGDIEIKFNITRSDNLMVKTQSYAYLVDRGVPADIALTICELVGDPNAIGKLIEENRAKLAEKALLQSQPQAKGIGSAPKIETDNNDIEISSDTE